MAKALTTKFVAAAKPSSSRQELADAACPGLYLIINPSGSKSWAVRCRVSGKPKKFTIGFVLSDRVSALPVGILPDLGDGHTLAEARSAAAAMLDAVKEGRDPASERKVSRAVSISGSDTVRAVLNVFLERHVAKKNRASTERETRRFISMYIEPSLGSKKMQRVAKADLYAVLSEVEERGGPASANRVLAIIRKFFNWAVDHDIVPTSPAKGVKAPAALVSRDRVLTHDEIRLFWKATENFGYPFGPLWRMLLLTAQRREEVAGATNSEINDNGNNPIWLIPRERAKNDKGHSVPLSAEVVGLVRNVPRLGGDKGFLFSTTGHSSVSGYSKAKTRLDKAMLEIAKIECLEAGGDPFKVSLIPWRLHDLRRTAASGMAALGIPIHVIEAILNHKSGSISGVAAVYNRHEYADEKRAALSAWSAQVLAIKSSPVSAM